MEANRFELLNLGEDGRKEIGLIPLEKKPVLRFFVLVVTAELR